MRRNWPFFKDSDWLILVFVHSAKPTAELENLAMSLSLSSPGLSYDTKFVHIGWELRSSLVGDTILGVQSEPACRSFGLTIKFHVSSTITYFVAPLQPARSSRDYERQATAAAVAVSYCLHQKAVFRHVLQRINQPTNTAIQSASYNQPTDAD